MNPRATALLATVAVVAVALTAFLLSRRAPNPDEVWPPSEISSAVDGAQSLHVPVEPPHGRSPLGDGQVVDRIEGRVFDAGEPVFDAVIACSRCSTASGTAVVATVTTDRDGAFAIAGLDDVCHQVQITREGYAPSVLRAEPGTFLRIDLQRVRVHGFVEGVVVDARGAPIDAFAVSILRARKGGWVSLVSAKPVSGTGGTFREPISLPDPENELAVAIQARGFRDAQISSAGLGASSRVDLGAIVLERFVGGVVGHVVDDHGGAPIAGATVVPVSTGGRTEDEVETDSSGRFTVDRVSGGDVVGVSVSATGFAPVYVASSEFGDAREPLVVRLGRGAEIRGTFVSSRSESLAGLFVGYWLDAGESVLPGLPTLVSSHVSVDAGGEYRLANVPTKPLLVGVVRPGATRMPPLVEFQRLTAVHCTEGERRTVDFVLGEGVELTATLIAPGRAPMTALAASLLADGAKPSAVVQCVVGARITFHDVAPGSYVLRVASMPSRFTDVRVAVSGTKLELGELDVSACFAR